MTLVNCLLVMAGGAGGTLARYLVSMLAEPISRTLPWGTMLINITGSFAIAFFGMLTLAGGRFPAPDSVRVFVTVGLCGGFTTFSTFSVQAVELLHILTMARAMVNIAATVTLCIGAAAFGQALAMRINGNGVPGVERPAPRLAEAPGHRMAEAGTLPPVA